MHIFQTLNDLFVPGGARLTFELELSRFLSVVGPWAKGTRCLEGAHITPDQVYFVFLGILAQHEEDFRKNEFRLKNHTIEGIRRIANARFDELINETPQMHDIYIASFVLNPGMMFPTQSTVQFLMCQIFYSVS
jgi:hypothetical protein